MKREDALERAIHVFKHGRYFPQENDDLVWITLEKIRRQLLKQLQRAKAAAAKRNLKNFKPEKEKHNG